MPLFSLKSHQGLFKRLGLVCSYIHHATIDPSSVEQGSALYLKLTQSSELIYFAFVLQYFTWWKQLQIFFNRFSTSRARRILKRLLSSELAQWNQRGKSFQSLQLRSILIGVQFLFGFDFFEVYVNMNLKGQSFRTILKNSESKYYFLYIYKFIIVYNSI